MNATLTIGTRVVVFALLSYTTAFVLLQRKKRVSPAVLTFQTAGIILDITATLMMVIGSPNTPFTIHGFFGYSALCLMLVKTFLIWNMRFKDGRDAKITPSFNTYSRIAYGWWVAAFVIGALLVMLKSSGSSPATF